MDKYKGKIPRKNNWLRGRVRRRHLIRHAHKFSERMARINKTGKAYTSSINEQIFIGYLLSMEGGNWYDKGTTAIGEMMDSGRLRFADN